MNRPRPRSLAVAGLLALSAAVAAPPADKTAIPPPSDYRNLRLGLWESTEEMRHQGGPKIDVAQLQAQMAGDMKDMTPEQRARVQALLSKQAAESAAPVTRHTHQHCITAAERDKAVSKSLSSRDDAEEHCTVSELSRSASKVVAEMRCSAQANGRLAAAGGGSDAVLQTGTITVELLSPTEYTSRLQMSGTMGGQPMSSDMTLHGHWVAADCGKVH